MGLFDRFKKKTDEAKENVISETVKEEAEEITETEPKADESDIQEAAEEAVSLEDSTEEVSDDEEAAAVEEKAAETTPEEGSVTLNQQIAQGIFNESIALYRSMPEDSRQETLKEALMDLTNDPLSKSFLEAISEQGMTTPERVRNNITTLSEQSARLCIVQLAAEGEGKPKQLQTVLGQTQTQLFRRILELNPSAGTSETASPKVVAPEGETPVEFFRAEINLKAIEKKLQEAQKAVRENGDEMKALHDSVTEKYNDSELSAEDRNAKVEEELKNFEEYQETLKNVEPLTASFNEAREAYLAAADALAPEILKLPVIYAAYDANLKPELPWISNDGHGEIYTSKKLAAQVEEGFKKQGISNMVTKELKGEEIAEFVETAQHLGIVHFLLDNGRTPIDLRFDHVKKYEEASLMEYANRAIRYEFIRAKSYGLIYGKLSQAEQNAEGGLNVRDRLLTMLFNGYREMGMGLSYTLMKAEHQNDTTFYTKKAFDMASTLKEKVFKTHTLIAEGDTKTSIAEEPLNLALVKRGSLATKTKEELDTLPSLVPVFSDIQSARKLQANLAIQHANYEVLAITWDELKEQAKNYPGLVYDPDRLGLFIPKEDFEKVDQFRRVRGNITINHNKK